MDEGAEVEEIIGEEFLKNLVEGNGKKGGL